MDMTLDSFLVVGNRRMFIILDGSDTEGMGIERPLQRKGGYFVQDELEKFASPRP